MITSLSNPLIKQARALRQRKTRTETGLFLVEGLHLVGCAFEAGWQVEKILYAPEFLTGEFAGNLLKNASSLPDCLQPVSGKIMESLADKENPQGILALVHQKQAQLQSLPTFTSAAALVAPQDPGNVGTILRTLDAVGADALFLLEGGVDPFHPTGVRASMGSLFWISIVQTTFSDFVEWAGVHGCQLIGSSAHAKTDYRAIKPRAPWILMFGNEQKGLSDQQIQVCDLMVSLPMRGHASSLNIAVSAGILMYQLINS